MAEFPSEAFVQDALERYVHDQGLNVIDGGFADLACVDASTGRKWVIEAKGKTKAIGIDFETGLGQLLKRMTNLSDLHGLAMPDIDQYRFQVSQIDASVCRALSLHWLFIDAQGNVELITP